MGARVSAASAVDAPGEAEEAAEIAVVIAKLVFGLASSAVRTGIGRRDDVVVDLDRVVVARDGRDRDPVRRRGSAASFGDFEAQRDGMRFGHGRMKHLQRLGDTCGALRALNACAVARGP